MIVKILSRNNPSYKSLMEYILNESKGKDGKPHIITHNLKGNQGQEGWARQYMENEVFRQHPKSNQIYLYHEIISFSDLDKEKITEDMLTDISKKYIELRGKNGIYLSAVHRDKEHIHIHFMVSGLEFRTGKAFRLSKTDLHELKVKIQEYHKQKYPEISESIVRHGKGREYLTDREWHLKHREARGLRKEEIGQTVKAVFEKAKSQNEFLALLRLEGLHHYERNGVPTGIVFKDTKFRFSRLDISKEKFEALPIDRTEEQKALDEIRAMRESRNEKSRDYERGADGDLSK